MATLTKREAIRECKRLWKEIEESGLTKGGFLVSPAGQKWVGKGYDMNCPLCEYANQNPRDDDCCKNCPLITQYDKGCYDLGFMGGIHSTPEWFKAIQGLK